MVLTADNVGLYIDRPEEEKGYEECVCVISELCMDCLYLLMQ